jgi:hypothetical protein
MLVKDNCIGQRPVVDAPPILGDILPVPDPEVGPDWHDSSMSRHRGRQPARHLFSAEVSGVANRVWMSSGGR